MKSARAFAATLTVVCLCGPQWCHGQTDPGVPYSLSSPPSQFEWGCFGPCACPVLIQAPLEGSFILRRSHTDPLFTYYDVLDVRWKVPGQSGPVSVTGSGTYRRGGEVALEEQLALDLSFDGGPPQHFDSGPRPPVAKFPEIDTRISLHQESCHDSVLAVDAKPTSTVGLGGSSLAPPIVATPNPFADATAIGFSMPIAGPARLAVFDAGGRLACTLLDRAWLPAGPAGHTWDGRLDDGREAPPGLYVARLESPAGRFTRVLVKLR